MRGGVQRGRRVRWLGLLLSACALISSVLLARPAVADPTPAPVVPSPVIHTAAAGKAPGIGVSVNLGILSLNVNVPLDIGGLLGPSSTPTPAPSTSAPPTHSTPTPVTSAPPPAPAGHTSRPIAAYPPTAPHPTATPLPPTSPTPTHPKPTHPSKPGPSAVYAHGVLPSSGTLVLVLLCIACGLGVAYVVRLSGGRRRL